MLVGHLAQILGGPFQDFVCLLVITWCHENQRNKLRSLVRQQRLSIDLLMQLQVNSLGWLLYSKTFKCQLVLLVFYDSIAAIHIASNPTYHEGTNHIDIDYHFICEKINVCIKFVHVRTHHQLAPLLTKVLPLAQFQLLLSKIGVKDIYLPSRVLVTL